MPNLSFSKNVLFSIRSSALKTSNPFCRGGEVRTSPINTNVYRKIIFIFIGTCLCKLNHSASELVTTILPNSKLKFYLHKIKTAPKKCNVRRSLMLQVPLFSHFLVIYLFIHVYMKCNK